MITIHTQQTPDGIQFSLQDEDIKQVLAYEGTLTKLMQVANKEGHAAGFWRSQSGHAYYCASYHAPKFHPKDPGFSLLIFPAEKFTAEQAANLAHDFTEFIYSNSGGSKTIEVCDLNAEIAAN